MSESLHSLLNRKQSGETVIVRRGALNAALAAHDAEVRAQALESLLDGMTDFPEGEHFGYWAGARDQNALWVKTARARIRLLRAGGGES